MTRTYWLASYPKSGSTWIRLLLANLGRATPVDINALPDDGEIASSRERFDRATLIPSALLSPAEIAELRPDLHRALASGRLDTVFDRSPAIDGARFVKVHDAWTSLPDGRALLGGVAAAAGAILIVRDPRAVVPSLAAHLEIAVDAAIAMMASPGAQLSNADDGSDDQLRQHLLDWSGHATSWLTQRDVPVHVVRYEDLHRDPATVFRDLLTFAGVATTAEACATAARHASFAQARGQEAARGFREANRARFFRRGLTDAWRTDLTPEQALRVEDAHRSVMERFAYNP